MLSSSISVIWHRGFLAVNTLRIYLAHFWTKQKRGLFLGHSSLFPYMKFGLMLLTQGSLSLLSNILKIICTKMNNQGPHTLFTHLQMFVPDFEPCLWGTGSQLLLQVQRGGGLERGILYIVEIWWQSTLQGSRWHCMLHEQDGKACNCTYKGGECTVKGFIWN